MRGSIFPFRGVISNPYLIDHILNEAILRLNSHYCSTRASLGLYVITLCVSVVSG